MAPQGAGTGAGRVSLPLLLVWASTAATSCAFLDESSPALAGGGAHGASPGRASSDDRDPPSLVPIGVETVIDVDIALLRQSPWVIPALEARDRRVRAARQDALGYDDVDDVDRVIYAVTTAGADAPTLVIAQGRFQSVRVQEAFRVRWPATTVDNWRGIAVLSSGENAIAFLTSRTFTAGAPASVHAVIDRSFGIGTDVSTDPALGPTRRALCPEGRAARPAVLATVAIDERMRARVGDAVPLPRELRQVGLRLDVGQSVELSGLGILDDRDAAAALARRLGVLVQDPTTRLVLGAVGLGMLPPRTRVTSEGARVLFHVSVDDEYRPTLAALLRTLVASRAGGAPGTPGAGSFGSW